MIKPEKLEYYKDLVVDGICLGQSLTASAYACGLEDNDIELLRNDAAFLRRIEVAKATRERELLAELRSAATEAAAHGNTKAAERILALLNPERYGAKASIDIGTGENGTLPKQINVNFVGVNAQQCE